MQREIRRINSWKFCRVTVWDCGELIPSSDLNIRIRIISGGRDFELRFT
jgi:hypothetical protein